MIVDSIKALWAMTCEFIEGLKQARRAPVFEKQSSTVSHRIFTVIANADGQTILRAFEQDKGLLDEVNADGATPLLFAFVLQMKDLGKELIRRYPLCAAQAYTDGPYKGENALHIAIIQQDTELVQWLLGLHPELMDAEVTGDFFAPAGNCYFGGYPLLFAVATQQPQMVDQILATRGGDSDAGNDLTQTDQYGNTCLHLAVVHDCTEMYDEMWERAQKEGIAKRLQHFANTDNLTPLALAVAMGHTHMFKHVLSKDTETLWEYGGVTCKMIPLRGLEQPYIQWVNGRPHPLPIKTAIECICASEPLTRCLQLDNGKVPEAALQGRLELIMIPEVQKLLDGKWEYFGKRFFYREFFKGLCTQFIWSISVIIPYHYSSSSFSEHKVNNIVIVACEVTVTVFVVLRIIYISRKYLRQIFKDEVVSAPVIWQDKLEFIFCALFIVGAILSLIPGACNVGRVFLACASVMGWAVVLASLIGFRRVGPFVIMMREMIVNDFQPFFMVYLVVHIGFTKAVFYLVDSCSECTTKSFFRYMIDFMLTPLGIFGFAIYDSGYIYWLVHLLLIVYMFLVVILLLNLLIAMMNNTYTEVEHNADLRWCVERTKLMGSYEGGLHVEGMQKLRHKYAIPLHDETESASTDLNIDFGLDIEFHEPNWKFLQKPRSDSSSTRKVGVESDDDTLGKRKANSLLDFEWQHVDNMHWEGDTFPSPKSATSPKVLASPKAVHSPKSSNSQKSLHSPKSLESPLTLPAGQF